MRALGADAASVFVLDRDCVTLRGAEGAWDWTRTSFAVRLDLWPTVKRAIEAREIVMITLDQAQELERDWFEPLGICCCVCAPLVAGSRVVGVLFADALHRAPAALDLSLVRRIAVGWAEALLAAERASHEPTPEESGVRRRPGTLTVKSLMSSPLMVEADVGVAAAERFLLDRGAKHVIVTRGGRPSCILTLTVLQAASPDALVGELSAKPAYLFLEDEPAERAARTMLEKGASCVPVLGQRHEVIGVVQREDLQRSGLLPSERGIDVCASCGEPDELGPRGEGDVVFCETCLRVSRAEGLDELYRTLGGSG